MKISRLVLLISLIYTACLNAEIAVIANLENKTKKLSKQQVQDIFMGRTRTFPNGDFVLPLDLNNLRNEFYTKITGRPIEQINAYWARIMFSGQASPPMKLDDENAVVITIMQNKGAIGFVETKNIDKKQVQILFLLE